MKIFNKYYISLFVGISLLILSSCQYQFSRKSRAEEVREQLENRLDPFLDMVKSEYYGEDGVKFDEDVKKFCDAFCRLEKLCIEMDKEIKEKFIIDF